MTLVQQFLRKNSLKELTDTYKIDAKFHGTFPNLVLLKYNQIESPMHEKIVQECRGIILDISQDFSIVSYGYNKFFNYGEGNAASIDWSDCRVYEKVDGSLCTLYRYAGEWHVATSGTPDAAGNVNDSNETFKELFWRTWSSLGYRLPINTTNCFMFELMTMNNRVVVKHDKPRIVLHGARSLHNLCEVDPIKQAQLNGWECVKTYPLNSFDSILEASKILNPLEQEGYVVCDSKFNRVKVKTPQYVAASHLKEGFSVKRVIEIVRSNEQSEVLNYFPEFGSQIEETKKKFDSLINEMEVYYNSISNIKEQKEFAKEALQKPYSGLLFQVRRGIYKDFRMAAADVSLDKLKDMLESR